MPAHTGGHVSGRGHTPNGVAAASYPQAHGGSSGYNTIQVNTHVNIYPNHMEGLPPNERDLAQTLPEPHQRAADYFAYDSRPPPPYSASQNAARTDPNQNISSSRLPGSQQLRAEYAQQFYADGNPRRPDMQATGGAYIRTTPMSLDHFQWLPTEDDAAMSCGPNSTVPQPYEILHHSHDDISCKARTMQMSENTTVTAIDVNNNQGTNSKERHSTARTMLMDDD
ncbi:hypothetical protein BDZ89DRAFT_1239730 [Hymenopellis radicata]|nr:hypothetical protein BDZ89DRAFT_1239730 [Hymenopellis radicata]